ncbi:hypothetical protein EW145_g7565 [Phellinidium pouzarii]|uniref:NmrA-like domain-containing protein n=1 Tax=Phellinidium pouzarii TaxID=167371 RepID=A0A4V3XAD4_9AGAM|nr:hypothetical protein EW145_g7565 [Phellinidium pouzarii]
MAKLSVIIVGATGVTGGSIVDALLTRPDFHVIALVRPASASKPDVAALQGRGVEIRIADIEPSAEEQLVEALRGADVVICAIHGTEFAPQYTLIDAVKKAGVKRYISNDWASACTRGVRQLHDEKLAAQDYVKKVGINYTFIGTGFWYLLPAIESVKSTGLGPLVDAYSREIVGAGDVKSAMIDTRDIGEFVARILLDERTVNRYVFCYGEEVTQSEIHALAERVSGHKIDRIRLRGEDIAEEVKTAPNYGMRAMAEYKYSGWVRGDNTIENAKKEKYGGALDARELYPDLKVRTLEEFANEYYLSQ